LGKAGRGGGGRGDGNRLEPSGPCGAKDTQGDLSAVRHEHAPHSRDGNHRRRTTSVARHSATSMRYGTASLVAWAIAPPPAAPRVWPGAQARLISANVYP